MGRILAANGASGCALKEETVFMAAKQIGNSAIFH
jgi:hypothetical protein